MSTSALLRAWPLCPPKPTAPALHPLPRCFTRHLLLSACSCRSLSAAAAAGRPPSQEEADAAKLGRTHPSPGPSLGEVLLAIAHTLRTFWGPTDAAQSPDSWGPGPPAAAGPSKSAGLSLGHITSLVALSKRHEASGLRDDPPGRVLSDEEQGTAVEEFFDAFELAHVSQATPRPERRAC
jgi:hypothetical protein